MQLSFLSPVCRAAALTGVILYTFASGASATLVGFAQTAGGVDDCANGNVVACTITTTPPNPVVQNPNNGVLLAWNERQNVILSQDLRVDRVFDTGASFVGQDAQGLFLRAGTVVSSHYLQWDPGAGSQLRVDTSVVLDSQVFAFITADQKLFDSDAALGLPGLDYADFGLRGLENGDTTVFNGARTDISWSASSPGDWTRLITAFSPSAAVPEPGTVLLMAGGLGLLGFGRKLRK